MLVLATALSTPLVATADPTPSPNPYWRDTWRGWHFYEDPPDEPVLQAAPPARPAAAPPPAPRRPPELQAFEHLQKSLEERKRIAIMRPTESNVRRYMEIEAELVARASTFADIAQRVAWASPSLDPSLQGRPVNARALEIFEAHQSTDRAQSVARLSADHVLLFFFRSDCPYCHAFAPALDTFRTRHGFKVLPISLDGGALPGFPDARPDNGIARTLQVSQVPALFLAQPFTGAITPIGHGLLSESQLLERIAVATTPMPLPLPFPIPMPAPSDPPTTAIAGPSVRTR